MLFFTKFAILLVVAIALFFLWIHRVYTYWKRRNIFSPPTRFPLGHMSAKGPKGDSLHPALIFKNLYDKYRSEPYVGLYSLWQKFLMVNNLDLIKNILSKDYTYFQGHGFKYNSEADPLQDHLFNLEGDEWKALRVKLTPTFTSSKMKYMFNTLLDCNEEMINYIDEILKTEKIVDIKEILSQLGTDVIGSCAFGIQTNSFKHPDAEFRKAGKKFFESNIFTAIHDLVAVIMPNLSKKIKVNRIPKEITKFFTKVVKDTIDYREKNNINRNDFLQMLIDMKNSKEIDISLPEITAQVFVFFLAGFETSSSTSTYTLLELAKNPQVKEKLICEIDKYFEENNGKLNYDTLPNIPYLTQAINETLRMYPPVPFLFRRCTRNYKVPESNDIIEKETPIIIPILGIQRNPEIYPDPDQYNPDRFTPEQVKDRHQYAHIPFGEGPRICIGSRFGMMQVRVALITLLRNYDIDVCSETEINPEFVKHSIILQTEKSLLLKLSKRNIRSETA